LSLTSSSMALPSSISLSLTSLSLLIVSCHDISLALPFHSRQFISKCDVQHKSWLGLASTNQKSGSRVGLGYSCLYPSLTCLCSSVPIPPNPDHNLTCDKVLLPRVRLSNLAIWTSTLPFFLGPRLWSTIMHCTSNSPTSFQDIETYPVISKATFLKFTLSLKFWSPCFDMLQ
jgi:hypothetical protein